MNRSLHLNAHKLGIGSARSCYDIVKEERAISPEMALRLGYVFGTTPDFWLNLQSEFDLRLYETKMRSRSRTKFAQSKVRA